MLETRMSDGAPFSGTKIVCLIGGRLLTLRRDDDPAILHPGLWDLPGGAREAGETPEACVLRELHEEAALRLTAPDLVWARRYDPAPGMTLPSWWFAARLPAAREAELVLGDEGQRLALMPVADWLAMPDVIGHFPARVRDALEALGVAV